MTRPAEIARLDEQAKRHFHAGRYEQAVVQFRRAAQACAEAGDRLNAAEQRNNLSVALLKLRRPREALDVVTGTAEIFAAAGDMRRQGMAMNNRASALQDLKRDDEALASYESAAELLGQAEEGDLRAEALRAAAALQFRRGRLKESGFKMLGALGSSLRPTFWERLLKSVWRRMQ